jgi:diacylglycerol kinase
MVSAITEKVDAVMSFVSRQVQQAKDMLSNIG